MDIVPCPDRIVDDCGAAYAMGCIGAAIWHGVKGYRAMPRPRINKFRGLAQAVRQRAPLTGGAFAVWGLSFSTFDCAISYYRKKEDPWNAIASGALTGGILALRAGPRQAVGGFIIGGVFLAMIEGLGIAMGTMMAQKEEADESNMMSPYGSSARERPPPPLATPTGGFVPPAPHRDTLDDDDSVEFVEVNEPDLDHQWTGESFTADDFANDDFDFVDDDDYDATSQIPIDFDPTAHMPGPRDLSNPERLS